MPQVLLVNPSPRKGASARKGATRAKPRITKRKPVMAKAKRSKAQQAATRKMIAANRARSRAAKAPRRPAAKKRASPARAAPARRTTKRRTTARRGSGGWPITSAAAASRAGRALRHRRPNPIGGFVKDTLMPSIVGGAGALALDVAVGVLPLPPAMKTGPMAPLVKAAGAVGIGMLAGQLLGRRTGEQVAAGALTVTVYNVARQMLNKVSGGRIPGLSEYVSMYPGMAEYVEYDPPQLGYESSGGQVGEVELEGYETGVYR